MKLRNLRSKPLIKNKSTFYTGGKNLIYIVIWSGCKEECIGQTQKMLIGRLNTYKWHIRQSKLQQVDVKGYKKTCSKKDFKIMQFFAICEDSRMLREWYETCFIDRVKLSQGKLRQETFLLRHWRFDEVVITNLWKTRRDLLLITEAPLCSNLLSKK